MTPRGGRGRPAARRNPPRRIAFLIGSPGKGDGCRGNPIAGITVNFTAPATGAGATLSAASAVTNSAGVASVTATANSTLGGYSVIASVGVFSATFSLTNSSFSPCDVNQDGKTNVLDVQKIIDEALGGASPVSDLNGDKKVSVVDIQIVIDAVLNLGCSAG